MPSTSETEYGVDCSWTTDADHRHVEFRWAVEAKDVGPCDGLGRRREQLAANGDSLAFWRSHLEDLAQWRPFRDFVYPHACRDGGTRWLRVSGDPVFDEAGRFAGYRGVGADVTVEREIIEDLADRNRRLDAALMYMPHGLVMTDAAERVVLCNERFLELFALSPDIVRRGMPMADLIGHGIVAGHFPGETLEGVLAARAERLASRMPSMFEQHLSNGRVIEVHFRPAELDGWVMIYEDVTERRHSQVGLANQTARLHAALEAIVQGFSMFDGDMRLLVSNERYATLFGLSRDAIHPGMTLSKILERQVSVGTYAGADPRRYVDERLQAARENKAAVADLRMRDGRVLSLARQPMPDGGWVATFEDITARRHVEAERIEQSRRFDTALESMPAGLCLFDANERLAVWNQRYSDLYGLAPGQLYRGMPYREILELGVGLGRHTMGRTVDEIHAERLAMVRGERPGVEYQTLANERIVEIACRAAPDDGWIATYQDVTERQNAERKLLEQNVRFDAALAHMSHGLVMVDADDRVVLANPKFLEFYNLSPETVKPGVPMREVVEHQVEVGNFADATTRSILEVREARLAKGDAVTFRQPLVNGRILEIHFSPLSDGRGWVTVYDDVTEQALADARNAEQNLRFDAALRNMAEGLLMLDADLRLIVCNERYRELFMLPVEMTAPGTALARIIAFNVAAGRHTGRTSDDLVAERSAIFAPDGPSTSQIEFGDGRILEASYRPMSSGGWVATYSDVTERRRVEARIAHMARHDALTDLPNRVLFHERLAEALSVDGDRTTAVFCLDLDRFKVVNDTLGHAIGDQLLRQVTQRLGCATSEGSATLARFGGDEFCLLLPDTNPEEASSVAKRLVDEVGRGYEVDGHRVDIGLSLGIALAPTDGRDPDHLLRSADLALYRAKADGRGTYRFFERDMDARMQARRRLEIDLRRALECDQLELHYQPLINLASGRVSGFEALARWRHPTRGLVPPIEFIPLAEEIGLIVSIGDWVLREACREAAGWPAHVRVAVNLSPVQFRSPGFALSVVAALGAAGLDPRRLELEITEGVLLQDTKGTLATLHELKRLGIRIAMDDFGTGYSSLSYLRSFPFDKIKIDRSFIADLATRSDAIAIVRAVTSLGASLGMTTTAEGIETVDQLDRLRAEGCTEVQGYLFSRPVPACQVRAMVTGSEDTLSTPDTPLGRGARIRSRLKASRSR